LLFSAGDGRPVFVDEITEFPLVIDESVIALYARGSLVSRFSDDERSGEGKGEEEILNLRGIKMRWWWEANRKGLPGEAIRAISEAWAINPEQVLSSSEWAYSDVEVDESRFSRLDGIPAHTDALVLSRRS
jgi:hypothetical protein